MPEIDDFLLDDIDDDKDDTPTQNDDDVRALKDEIAQLKKESYGRLQETKTERQRRQNLQIKLDKLSDTVNGILQQRSADNKSESRNTRVIGVDETDSGDLFIPQDKLEFLTKPLEDRIAQLQRQLEAVGSQYEQRNEAQEVINAIVGENDSFTPAYSKYQSARKWVNDQVIEFQRENNIRQQMTSGAALDNVFDKDLEEEFKSKFPGLDLERIVTAEDSQRHFRRTLESIAKANEELNVPIKTDDRFRKVLQKPSSLSANRNAKAAELNVSEKLEGITADDIMNMTDSQVAALERAMLREEQTEGVSF